MESEKRRQPRTQLRELQEWKPGQGGAARGGRETTRGWVSSASLQGKVRAAGGRDHQC